ncbi:CLUMA_CG018608, isoform A [Clunio marinus]|uniref:CLUMA_CG018608, isoform A n=1 Tax=Clunio marinus TaxID=568069 RepID=A0A1J1IXV0_9DIPT|nr:CLUMA_CG018608, isoform A [Clunio marinus]
MSGFSVSFITNSYSAGLSFPTFGSSRRKIKRMPTQNSLEAVNYLCDKGEQIFLCENTPVLVIGIISGFDLN